MNPIASKPMTFGKIMSKNYIINHILALAKTSFANSKRKLKSSNINILFS